MYAEVSEDFNTKYNTWVIAFCPDTDSFFATNERHFFWESPNEFKTEDEAIRNFALDTLYYVLIRNKFMSNLFYGDMNIDHKVFLENTKQWYYVSLSSYKTIFRDYQIMRKNRVACAICILESKCKHKVCDQCEIRYNEIEFYSMKSLIEKMNTLLTVKYYATTKIEDLVRRYSNNMTAKQKLRLAETMQKLNDLIYQQTDNEYLNKFYQHTEKYVSLQSAKIALKSAGLTQYDYARAIEILDKLPPIYVTVERARKDITNNV